MNHLLKIFPGQISSPGKRPLFVIPACFALASVLVACAAERAPPETFRVFTPAGSQSVVGIRVKPYAVNIDIEEPVGGAGKGAFTGAAMGTDTWSTGLSGASDPYTTILYVALLPVAVVTGSLAGAIAAHPESEVTGATTAIKSALSDANPSMGIQEAIATSLSSLFNERIHVKYLPESEMGISPDQLVALGFDALLDVEISHLDLAVYGTLDPDASLTMTIRASLMATDTRAATPLSSWTYLGERHDYFELAEDDAYLLRGIIKNSYREIADILVKDYFE